MMVAILVLTLVTAIVAALAAAHALQTRPDAARALAAKGIPVHRIARRTGLPQDVVAMLLNHRVPARRRKKLPRPVDSAQPARTQPPTTQTRPVGIRPSALELRG